MESCLAAVNQMVGESEPNCLMKSRDQRQISQMYVSKISSLHLSNRTKPLKSKNDYHHPLSLDFLLSTKKITPQNDTPSNIFLLKNLQNLFLTDITCVQKEIYDSQSFFWFHFHLQTLQYPIYKRYSQSFSTSNQYKFFIHKLVSKTISSLVLPQGIAVSV